MRSGRGPDFLVVGAQKCGTTWLHENLLAHPGVWLPPEKELHFFDERIHAGRGLVHRVRGDDVAARRWRRQVRRWTSAQRGRRSLPPHVRWYARYFLGGWDVEWYRGLFQPGPGQVGGEVTPDYGLLPAETVARVRAEFPWLRIVLLARHPVERLWSHARMEARVNGGRAEDIAVEMLDRRRPLAFSDYVGQLRRWAEPFGTDRVLLGFMEDVARHPRLVLDEVTDHISAPRHDHYPKAEQRIHSGGTTVIPGPVAVQLADGLLEDVRAQARTLGGHAHWWAWSTEQLAAGVGEAVAYPLWDSALFERYVRAVGEDVATGCWTDRLDTVLTRARRDRRRSSDAASQDDHERPEEDLQIEHR